MQNSLLAAEKGEPTSNCRTFGKEKLAEKKVYCVWCLEPSLLNAY